LLTLALATWSLQSGHSSRHRGGPDRLPTEFAAELVWAAIPCLMILAAAIPAVIAITGTHQRLNSGTGIDRWHSDPDACAPRLRSNSCSRGHGPPWISLRTIPSEHQPPWTIERRRLHIRVPASVVFLPGLATGDQNSASRRTQDSANGVASFSSEGVLARPVGSNDRQGREF
jgi:hypothetical protein